MKKTYFAREVNWDVDPEEIKEILDELSAENAAEMLGIDPGIYSDMSADERYYTAADLFRHCPAKLDEFLGFPDYIVLPDEVCPGAEEDISSFDWSDAAEWLSQEFGYCIEGFCVDAM